MRRASIRDFHSFRVTWVTLALTAGVPLELVQKVTGHKTVDVVLKHYFQPGREEFRRALQSAMPKLLTGPETEPSLLAVKENVAGYELAVRPGELLNKALKALDNMTEKSWKKKRNEVVALIGWAKSWIDRHVLTGGGPV